MDTKYGVRGNEFEGVYFTEQAVPGAHNIQHIQVELSLQNSNLNEVKRQLARKAKSLNANAVMNFRYGQKAHPWWEQLFTFKWDTESWHGEGDAIRI